MKKTLLVIAAFIGSMAFSGLNAFNQALYVVKDGKLTKYNFGVAGDLKFSDSGHSLRISGYSDIVNLDNIDYISFNPPMVQGALTPYAQKQKMIETGQAVAGLVNQKSIGDLLRMIDAFFCSHELKDGNYFYPASGFDVPKEYWDVHGVVNEFNNVMKAVKGLAGGNPACIRNARNGVVDLYRLSDYFGVYTADYENEVWVRTESADFLEIRFKGYDGTNYSVRFDCNKEFSYWESVDFKGEFPEEITASFNVNSIKVADFSLKSRFIQDEKISLSSVFTASEYEVEDDFVVNNSLITDDVRVLVDGKLSISARNSVNGANLVRYDVMKNDIKESTHYHDEEGNCCGDNPESLISHFYRAGSEVDILGMLQVSGTCHDFSRLYDIMIEDEDESEFYTEGYRIIATNGDKSVITVVDHDEDKALGDRLAVYFNDYSDAQFFYDGKPDLQGFLSFSNLESSWDNDLYYGDNPDWGYTIVGDRLKSVYRNYDDIWIYADYILVDGEYQYKEIEVKYSDVIFPSKIRHIEYDVEPLLTFPDMTTYAFEDFFDEGSFTDLINDFEEIINTYESITGQK